MMSTTSGNGRIVKRKLADSSMSMSFSVVRNMRINGRPCHLDLAKIGTFRQSQFVERAAEFWEITDAVLEDLVKTNKLWSNDRQKIEKQFAALIPRPPAHVATRTVELPESNAEILKSLVAELAAKAEQKLRERGHQI